MNPMNQIPDQMKEKMRDGITSFVDSHHDEQLDFLIRLCDQNSYTDNKEGVDRVGDMILANLGGILPVHEVIRQENCGNHHILRSSYSSGAIYLIGHMDTVFPPDHPFQKCHTTGDVLTGPGTGDMKGGLAVIVFALKALKNVGFLDELNLILILGGDEETGSITSGPIYLEERSNAIACLVAECAGLRGEVVVSRNGKLGARIDSYGKDRHIGNGEHEKASAILELATQIIAAESLNGLLPGVTINVGKIEGGLGPCTIPSHAGCLLDVRWVEEHQKLITMSRLSEKVTVSQLDGCRSELNILNSRPAMTLHSGTEEMLRLLQETGHKLGLRVGSEHRRGTSDANFFGSAGVPTIDGFGPICRDDHTADEHINISSLAQRTLLLAHFLVDLGRRRGTV